MSTQHLGTPDVAETFPADHPERSLKNAQYNYDFAQPIDCAGDDWLEERVLLEADARDGIEEAIESLKAAHRNCSRADWDNLFLQDIAAALKLIQFVKEQTS